MSSRGFNNNNNNTNANEKATYSEKDLVKLLKLSKLVSTKDDNPPMSFQQPYPYMPQQSYMPQQPYMPQQITSQQYQELTKDERDEVRRMIYKSNEELEENLKNFIMSNQKKFLLYIKELLDYQSTVKTAENIQVKEEEEKKAEEAPQSANNVADTLKQMPSNIGSMFSNVTSTISGVVQSANSMFTGKKEPTATSTTPATPATTTPTTTNTPATTNTPTNTKPSDLSIDNISEGQPSSSNEDESDNELDKILKEENATQPKVQTPTTPSTPTPTTPTPPVTTSTTSTTPKSEIAQLKESNKKAEEQLNKLKLEMKNLVPSIKQKGGRTLKNKKKNGSKKKKNSKRKIRKTNNLS